MTNSAILARRLMRARHTAVLATALPGDGHPYASLVLVAVDHDASPILLLSDLAEHARNIAADNRVSLLFDGTRELPSPLTGARLSVQGRAVREAGAGRRMRFLARHEDAAEYADFADFAIYSVAVGRGHLVAGFGKIEWLEGTDLLLPGAGGMAAWEAGAVSHMNGDHGDAIQDYAQNLLGATGAGWVMTGCDPEGCDLRRGGEVLRLDFETPAFDTDSLRQRLAALARAARAKPA
jgi:putative heme iron utilization protein